MGEERLRGHLADDGRMTIMMGDRRIAEYDPDEMQEFVMDSVVPGYCTNCGYECGSCEPDARENWCDVCKRQAIKSVLVLASLM